MISIENNPNSVIAGIRWHNSSQTILSIAVRTSVVWPPNQYQKRIEESIFCFRQNWLTFVVRLSLLLLLFGPLFCFSLIIEYQWTPENQTIWLEIPVNTWVGNRRGYIFSRLNWQNIHGTFGDWYYVKEN